MTTGGEHLDWFGALADEVRRAVEAETVVVEAPQGALIFEDGAPSKGIFRILKGRVRFFFLGSEGREFVARLWAEGETFGDLAAIDGRSHPGFAEAQTDCRLQHLSLEKFQRLRAAYPAIDNALMPHLCANLRAALGLAESAALYTLPARVASRLVFLCRAAEARGERSDTLKIQQKDIGLLVGASRQAVNRALAELSHCRAIRTRYGAIAVTDLAALERIAHSA